MKSKVEFYKAFFEELEKKGFGVAQPSSPDYVVDIQFKGKTIAFYTKADMIEKNPFVEVPEKQMERLWSMARATASLCGICSDQPYEEEKAEKLKNGVMKLNEHNGVILACKKHPLFDYVQRRGREQRLLGVIGRDDVRGMLKLLRAGGVVWYAPDQDYGAQRSVFVPLFGVPAATVTATSKFARMGRAQVIPFTQQRLPDGQGYRLVIHPPLADFPTDSEEADCLRVNQWIEQAISQCPEQYLWAHRRFKTRPEGEPKLYKKKR